MNTKILIPVIFITLVSGAEARRCDCNVTEGFCAAKAVFSDGWITLTSSTRHCARVIYMADRSPQSALLIDGKDQIRWLYSNPLIDLEVIVCEICADNELGPYKETSGP